MQKLSWMLFTLILIMAPACQSPETAQTEQTAVAETVPESAVPTNTPTLPPPPAVANAAATATAVPTQTANEETAVVPTIDPADLPDGALIAVSMNGRAGVLLDEIPAAMRDDVAAALLDESAAYWLDLARRQIGLTKHRLNFRNFVYAGKGQLPLPPPQLWQVELAGAPFRDMVNGHDLVMHDYTFASTLLTDAASPGLAEPALTEVGGVWTEPFIFPLDPDLLLQRTGNACLNEAGFPPNSYDSENTNIFYDFACTPASAGPLGCHRSTVPTFSCLEMVDGRIGRFETSLRFERLPWDGELADAVRVGDVTHLDAPDLQVVAGDLLTNRVIYRYFGPNACALEENAIGAPGWRRLLQFDATLHNVGGRAMHIGPVVAEDPLTNIFEYNACHDHFHFSNYGDFIFESAGQTTGSKQAFCVESTDRFSNNEASPLVHEYTCSFQGIEAGWVDEYGAGLDVQWIDITDVEIGEEETAVAVLGFISNTDQFLCEGAPVLDENGNQLYEPSGQRTAAGLPISRPQCDFVENWDANNTGLREISIAATGSFVTAPCVHPHLGPLRNCGFTELDDTLTCTPGDAVTLNFDAPQTPQVLRVCEVSAALGAGVACTYNDAISTAIVAASSTQVSFTCPAIRDLDGEANEDEDEDEAPAGGGFSLYTAPVFWGDETEALTFRSE